MSSYRKHQHVAPRNPSPKRITAPATARLSSVLSSEHDTTAPEASTSPPADGAFLSSISNSISTPSQQAPENAAAQGDPANPPPPPIPAQHPARHSPITPPRTSSANSPRRNRASSNRNRQFIAGALGEAPREDDENEKPPPPYTATVDASPSSSETSDPPSSAPSNGATDRNDDVRGEVSSGNAWASSPYLLPPKPTLLPPPGRQPSSDFRRSLFRSRRGGLWRLLFLLLLLLLLLGLGLGLGLGLTIGKRKHNETNTSPGSAGDDTAPPFPIGNWTIPVVLQTQNSACSSRPETFTCFPYTTYSDSPSRSAFTFLWTITSTSPSSPNNDTLSITANANTFALTFGPTPLQHLDVGSANERFAFEVPVPKDVQPSVSLGSGERDMCRFPTATLKGALYVHGNGTGVGSGDGGTGPEIWPGTTWISHESSQGLQCTDANSGAVIPVAPGAGLCECGWVTGNGTATP
ncbi:MAG: hypothetical protein Q9162_004527 [Coniocarpon cinnabarinum]